MILNLNFSDAWKRVLARARPVRLSAAATALFQVLDTDGDGSLSKEVMGLMTFLMHHTVRRPCQALLRAPQMTRRGQQEFRRITFSLPQAEIDHFFAQIDSGETAPD